MILQKYQEITIENTVKLLVRCKQLVLSRRVAYETLQKIVEFERDAYQLRQDIDLYLEQTANPEVLQKIQVKAIGELPQLAQGILDGIVELRDQYKLFSKMGATTSRGNQVLNVMAYKRRDALRYIVREYDAIRRLVQVVDIQMPAISLS